MIWTLKNWRTTDLIIADFVVWSFDPTMPDFWLPRYEALSPMQAHAAYRFVQYSCDYSGDEESRHAWMPIGNSSRLRHTENVTTKLHKNAEPRAARVLKTMSFAAAG